MSDRDSWKDEMFRGHAEAFADLLSQRAVSLDLAALVGASVLQGRPRFATLDLGCGVGRLAASLARASSLVVGFDYSPELLARAATTLRDLSNVILVRGDFRALTDHFAPDQFDCIVRAYTSLGYFEYDVEQSILRQCARISSNGATIILDTFNAQWFRANNAINRSTPLANFDWVENYHWINDANRIDCHWTYRFPDRQPIEIDFQLDGYDQPRVERLLRESGWIPEVFLTGYDRALSSTIDRASERLVIIAKRAIEVDGSHA